MSNPSGVRPLFTRRQLLTALGVLGGAGLAGCSVAATPVTTSSTPISSGGAEPQALRGQGSRIAGAAPSTTGTAVAAFGLAALRAAVTTPTNAVISPYSLLSALGMTSYGATDSAAAAFLATLGGDADAVAAWISAIDAAVAEAVKDSAADRGEDGEPSIVSPANSLFVQHGTDLRKTFLDKVTAGYGTPLYTVDFKSATEQARSAINGWVDEKTRHLIPELLAAGTVTPDWRLALVNALYLKAQWDEALEAADTDTAFHAASGGTQQVSMLMAGKRSLRYAQGTGWQSATLPYRGHGLAMTFLVPDAGKFADVLGAIEAQDLVAACTAESQDVVLSFPTFETDLALDMTDPLAGMGLQPAMGVPLTGMSDGTEPLEIDLVVHHARISVDENGTEAAAATVVGMEAGAAPGQQDEPIVLEIDRPFVYVIHDTVTSAPLFLGTWTGTDA